MPTKEKIDFHRLIIFIFCRIFFVLLKHVKACPHIKIYHGANILHLFRVDIYMSGKFYFLIHVVKIWDFLSLL